MPEVIQELTGLQNQKLTQVPPSAIRAFDNEISAVDGIIKLTLGEPDFATPEHVKEAAIKSIQDDDSHYAPSAGKPELRQAIAKVLKKTRGVDYDWASEVTVTVGATEALTATTFGLLNPGDKVLVPTPVFSLYFPIISLTG
ncbi:MAG: aminotransferase class I/II-fold pyridoxal phosphate-dependent enzyme, partial [Limosilactobacillus fermentum]